MQYELRESALNWLRFEVEKLNKRAIKLNLPPIEIKVLSTKSILTQREEGLPYHVLIHTVEVIGETTKINGWQFAASIDHTDGGNIFSVNPTFSNSIPDTYRHSSYELCEHCGVERFRNKTYIVHSEINGWKQVGSRCLKDFLGHKNPQQLANFATYFMDCCNTISNPDFDPDFGSGGYGCRDQHEDLKEILTISSAIIKVKGYTSNKKVMENGGTSTSSYVYYFINPGFGIQEQKARKEFRESIPINDSDKELAQKIIDWAKELSNPDGDYLKNLKIIATNGYFNVKHLGIVVSMIIAYKKATETFEKRQSTMNLNSNYVGDIGSRTNMKLKVVKITKFEGNYGMKSIILFKDAQENVLVWFACGSLDLPIDEELSVTATIKAHKEYKGIKQTYLTRAKVK